MAPKQAQCARNLTSHCDLYALGCVLYDRLTGATPFERKSALAILRSHLTARVPSLSEKRPDAPPRLEEICMKLLAKERGQRYQTPDELLADLQELKV